MRTSLASVAVLTLAWAGCGPGDDDGPSKDGNTQPSTITDTSTDTDDTDVTDTGTGPTGTTFDCANLPGPPTVWHHLDYVPSSEDFTFGADGYLYGVSTQSTALVRTPLNGPPEVILPGVSTWGRGTRFLLDGTLAIAEPDSASLIRVDLAGPSVTQLANNLSQPNGVAIGEDGFIYLTQDTGRVMRIDPNNGGGTMLYDTPVSTDGIAFAPDYRTLYWNSESGQVIKVELDDQGAIVDGPSVFADLNLGMGFDLLDGMTVDVCGNLYVVRMAGVVVRITPDGQQEEFLNFSGFGGGVFISAVNFGSGTGGWPRENLYVMNLNGGIFEIEVGIPGRWEPHLPVP